MNTSWNLVNFRSSLIQALVDDYEVVAVAPCDEYVPRLTVLGCRYIDMPMDNKGTNPARDLLLLWRFIRLFRAEKPDIYLGYTIKPNIYGSLAAHILGIPVINSIEGLGAAFIRESWITKVVRGLYRVGLSRSKKVYFLNDDDQALFLAHKLVSEAVADRIPGIGVDLMQFEPTPLPNQSPLRFLLIARMLWDKGIGEFVEAARILKAQGINAEFCLLGWLDVQNPAAISRAQMDEWVSAGLIRYLGTTDDVRPHLASADCVVLPSYYREGVPRTLLEAAAMARPIVTTDSVGCRDVVDDGINGYLCRPRDALDLAAKLTNMAALTPSARQEMGIRGREKAERQFDEKIVIDKYLQAIRAILRCE